MTNFVGEIAERIEKLENSVTEISRRYDTELAATRERLTKDLAQQITVERSKMALSFITVLDELERAVKHANGDNGSNITEGVEIVIEIFKARLVQLGVERLAVVGEKYDPEIAHAIGVENGESGVVTLEVLPGYRMDGRLIRPANVLVGNGQPVTAVATVS
jgi:molecular chaperone GrpE